MQRVTARFIIKPLVLIALLTQLAFAEEGIFFKRNSLHQVDSINNIYLISAQIDFQLTPYLKQALMNGVVLNTGIYIGLGERRSWWWNKTDSISTINYQLKYHALSRHFLLTRNDTNENWNYRSLSTALRSMGRIVNHKLPGLSLNTLDGNHYLFMGVRLSPSTLRLPLKIQSLFSDEYSLSSEVVSWPLP